MPPSPASQSQTATFANSGTQTVTFAPYDTSLGPLTSVGVTVSSKVDAVTVANNYDSAPATAAFTLAGTFDAGLPDGGFSPAAEVSAEAANSAPLGVPASGADHAAIGLTASRSATFTISSSTSSLAMFTGAGPVSLTVAGLLGGTISGSANIESEILGNASTQVTLDYNYSGPGTPVTIGSAAPDAGGVVSVAAPVILAGYLGPVGSVTTAPQTVSEPDRTTGWSDNALKVAQFDPTLGRLEAVNLILDTDVSGRAVLAGGSPEDAPFDARVTATLALALPGEAAPITQASTLYDTGTLAGEVMRHDPLSGGGTVASSATDAVDLAAFTGTGEIPLNLSTTDSSSVSGPSVFTETLSATLGATVSVSYTYLPATLAAAECFAAGTRIATPEGDTCVESLVAGSCALTVSGRAARVVWVGRRHIDCRRHPRPREIWPVRIRAHAFAEGVPRRDVLLSPDHAVFMDGVLIPVRHLADSAAVAQVPVDDVTYVHVELDRHDVLLADGLPAESYLDAGARAAFEGGPVVQAVPDFAARAWDAHGCAPLVVAGPEVDRVRAVLAARASAAAA